MAHNNSSIYLVFSTHQSVYAEVAAYFLAKPGFPLRLGLDLGAAAPTCIIPAGLLKNHVTCKISGKASILRFFSRLGTSKLYESLSLQSQLIVDDHLDTAKFTAENALKSIENLKTPFVLAESTTPSLADLISWDLLKASSKGNPLTGKAADYVKRIEEISQVNEAMAQVEKTLESANLIDVFKLEIAEQLASLLSIDASLVFSAIEIPPVKKNGDFSIPFPKLKVPGNPVALAQETAKKFKTNERIIKASASGPFLNFEYSKELLRDVLIRQVNVLKEEFGSNASGFGQTAVVEYSSPNIAKPFHAGHLRSTIIGNFVKHVLNANGWKTISINYLGDWGKQYGLLAYGFHKYGSREALEKDPIRHLFDVYVKINVDAKEDPEVDNEARRYFKKMEDGDKEALALWKEFRDLSIVKYKEIFARLNVEFDIYSGESKYSLDQMADVLKELRELGLLVPDNGAEIVNMKDYGLGAAVIAKSDGSMLYLSRDIAAAIDRQQQYMFDKMVYVVGNQQDHHFRQLIKILELMGKPWAEKIQHVNFGMIKSKTGQMSTRKGTVVFLEDILDHTKEEMHNVMKSNAEKYAQIENPEYVSDLVGISSIIIQDMSARRHKDYEFDWSRMLSFEGDTGPYLQYAHSRLCSIERGYGKSIDLQTVNLSKLTEPQAFALLDFIALYPRVVSEVAKSFEPTTVVTYMYELCHRVSAAIENLYVKGQEPEIADARMAMYSAARITLGNALELVGLRPLERM